MVPDPPFPRFDFPVHVLRETLFLTESVVLSTPSNSFHVSGSKRSLILFRGFFFLFLLSSSHMFAEFIFASLRNFLSFFSTVA